MGYDSTVGNLRSTTTPRGFVTTYSKDGIGRDTLVVSPIDTALTQFARQHTAYDLMDRVRSSIQAGGSGSAAESVLVANAFDPNGNLLAMSRTPAPDRAAIGTATTRWRYDLANRRVAAVAPDGYVDSTAYDPASNVTVSVTRRGYTITQQFDALNRLTKRILPDVAKLDSAGFPRYTLPSFADTLTFTYDAVGNLLTANNHDALIHRTYNLNKTVQTDTLWIRAYADTGNYQGFGFHVYGLRHGYDLDGRRVYTVIPQQLGAHFASAPTVIYDSLAFVYTNFGPLGVGRDVLGNAFSFAYDLNSRLDTLYYPQGDFKAYTYDSDADPTDIHESHTFLSGSPNDIQARYDAQGKAVGIIPLTSLAGYGYESTGYDPLGPLTGQDVKTPSMAGPYRDDNNSFSADPLGNTVSTSDTYEYWFYGSSCGGGTPWQVTGRIWDTRTYAPATGRLMTIQGWSGETQQAPPSCISTSSGSSRSETREYDHAGNNYWTGITERDSSSNSQGLWVTNSGSETTARYYDAADRLRVLDAQESATRSDAPFYQTPPGFEEYRYDALGRRVLRRARKLPAGYGYGTPDSTGQIARFVWNGSQSLVEIQYPGSDSTPDWQLEWDTVTVSSQTGYFGRVIHLTGAGIDQPVSVVRVGYAQNNTTSDPIVISPRWNLQGKAYDHAFYGSTPGVTITWPARQPFYQIASPSTWAHFSYSGWFGSLAQDQMDATGQLYRRNRYYDASAGRFTQEDPLGLAGGLNLYGFAGGDPVNFSDPFGLCSPEDKKRGNCTQADVGPTEITGVGREQIVHEAERESAITIVVVGFVEGALAGGRALLGQAIGLLTREGAETAAGIPKSALSILKAIRESGEAPGGYEGGSQFLNDGRGGGQVLPAADEGGNPISYREWDVNPYQPGVDRGAQRLVTGSDGSAYYTGDHYTTFTRVPE